MLASLDAVAEGDSSKIRFQSGNLSSRLVDGKKAFVSNASYASLIARFTKHETLEDSTDVYMTSCFLMFMTAGGAKPQN